MRALSIIMIVLMLVSGYRWYAGKQHIHWRYASEGGDHSVVKLALYKNHSFRLSCAYYDDSGLGAPHFFKGTYTESINTFDLNFTHMCAELNHCNAIDSKTVKDLLLGHANEAGTIRNKPYRVRISKIPISLFLCDSRMLPVAH